MQAAIFDLDGTLLDSLGVWEDIDRAFLGARGFTVPEDYVRAIAPLSPRASAQYTIARFGLRETVEEVLSVWNEMAHRAYSEHIALKPFARDYLLRLQAQGIRLAVATASHEDLFLPALRRNGIADLFESYTTLNEVQRGKGFPDVYLRAAQKLGLAPAACTVYEDLLAGICAAKEGGFYTVGIYDPGAQLEWPLIQASADHCALGYAQLLDE
jgi:HAD superfamily hydrolase (TIGR01509 family)